MPITCRQPTNAPPRERPPKPHRDPPQIQEDLGNAVPSSSAPTLTTTCLYAMPVSLPFSTVDDLKNACLAALPTMPDDPIHPMQIALRTYALSLSLSLGPSLIPFVTSLATAKRSQKTGLAALRRVLRREFGYDGFAFALTLCVGGGAAIRHLWSAVDNCKSLYNTFPVDEATHTPLDRIRRYIFQLRTWLQSLKLSEERKTLLSNVLSSSVGILLLQAGRQRASRLRRNMPSPSSVVPLTPPSPVGSPHADQSSPTLDLTLLLLVRALDSLVQASILHFRQPKPNQTNLHRPADLQQELQRHTWTSRIDAVVFWASSARIMWCFFYQPERLPRSYVKWINTLASVDQRLLYALRLLRDGTWSYRTGSPTNQSLLRTYAQDLGHPASWGDPSMLPAYGGAAATAIWKTLDVKGRSGVGGLPCEVVHGHVGLSLGLSGSCTANTVLRGMNAFMEAVAIYLPVHFAPILLTRPQALLQPHKLFATLLGALRSASFLSSFVALYWYPVCITRTIAFAKLLPFISHDFWDGPHGCILAGSLMCGSSIWIENGRRRGEMALYVLPRAVRACLPDVWVKSGNSCVRMVERLAFILSISYILTAAVHRPDTLRGLSRWTVSFVTNGPSAGFWKRKRRDPGIPPTPVVPDSAVNAIDSLEHPDTHKISHTP